MNLLKIDFEEQEVDRKWSKICIEQITAEMEEFKCLCDQNYVRIQKITTITGFNSRVYSEAVLKQLQKDYNCNWTIVNNPEFGIIIRI